MTPPELVAALVKAQAAFPAVVKGSDNKFFDSKYADLAGVLNVVRPVLTEHGLAIVQLIGENEHGTVLETRLLHASGALVSVMPLAMGDLKAQEVGSLLTYYRRYSALAICGVHPEDDDDDGNAANAAGPQANSGRATASTGKPATAGQVKFAGSLLTELCHHLTNPLDVIAQQTGRRVPVAELFTYEASKLIDWLKVEKEAGHTIEAFHDGEAFPTDGALVEEPPLTWPSDDDTANTPAPEAAKTARASGPSPTHRQTPE